MAEPVSTTSASATLATIGLIAVLPGISAEVVLGAFAGAIVFILSSAELGSWRRLVFFVASFVTGVLAAGTVGNVLKALLPTAWSIAPGVCAMIAAAIVVRLLQWLIRRANDPESLIRDVKNWRAPK